MSFAKKPERPRVPALRGAQPSSLSYGLLLRTVIVGLLAIAGAVWGLIRHYNYTPPPMRVPVAPAEAPTYDVDAGELPVPDWAADDASR
jgi:hypothetical protein